jgi:hypothetical protein
MGPGLRRGDALGASPSAGMDRPIFVIPTKVGIHLRFRWVPAFAGMTHLMRHLARG